jgi:hypothetical protein
MLMEVIAAWPITAGNERLDRWLIVYCGGRQGQLSRGRDRGAH